MQAHDDQDLIYIARGAPRRWYTGVDRWGIANAPTRLGHVSFTLQASFGIGKHRDISSKEFARVSEDTGSRAASQVAGMVTVSSLPNAKSASPPPLIAVHLRTARAESKGRMQPRVTVTPPTAAKVLVWHASNETVVFQPQGNNDVDFNFTAVFA